MRPHHAQHAEGSYKDHAQVGRIWLKTPALFNMTRCSGTTRKGSRCTITNTSQMKDNSGRLVCQPLCRGGEYCLLHAKPFVVRPASPGDHASVRDRFLDLESTGVDVAQDRIVEMAATHAPADHRLVGGSYSTTVRVDPPILQERGGEAAAVHGISDEEITLGPSFPVAWARFLHWAKDLLKASVEYLKYLFDRFVDGFMELVYF
jgi:hypothetical protein